MNAKHARVDNQGWLDAMSTIDSASKVDLQALAYEVGGAFTRLDALLRALELGLEADEQRFGLHDVVVLTELMRETMPKEDYAFDLMDRFGTDITNLVCTQLTARKFDREVIEALTVACDPTADLGAMDRAAKALCEAGEHDERYAPQWAAFSTAVQARGLCIDLLDTGRDWMIPTVRTPESAKEARKLMRRQKAWLETLRNLQAREAAEGKV